jgi:hypothetical protein
MHECLENFIKQVQRLHSFTMDAAMLQLLLARCSDAVNVNFL